eukprot:3478517-Amphidinium_carterae.2
MAAAQQRAPQDARMDEHTKEEHSHPELHVNIYAKHSYSVAWYYESMYIITGASPGWSNYQPTMMAIYLN